LPFFFGLPFSKLGAGKEGFPDPLDFFVSPAAVAMADCDSAIALKSFTTEQGHQLEALAD
jgi:hypothetical protein